MKKFFTVLAVAAVVVACSKETESFYKPNSGDQMIIRANIPEMTDITKATADGSFSWADGDEIAVPIEGGYVVFEYQAAQTAFTYTPNGSEVFISGKVYYPASSRPSGSYSTAFTSAEAARAGFKMEADYTAGASSLSFTHKSSLIKLNFDNVPSFATSVRVKAGDDVVATVALSAPGSLVEVKVPVTPDGEKTYSFALMEGEHVIKEVSKADVTLTAGTYYTTPEIAINKYVVFNNSNNATHRIGLGKRNDDMSWRGDWATFDLTTTGSGVKYFILPDEYSYPTVPGIQVELRQNDGADEYAKSTTEFVVPVRNLIFDVSANSLKTSYRCYAKFNESQWGYWVKDSDVVKFRWGYDARPAISGSDVSCTEVPVASGKLFYYEFPDDMYGYDNVYWGFYNPVNYSWVSDWDNATINKDMQKIL